jgi:microcystin-dependent protein
MNLLAEIRRLDGLMGGLMPVGSLLPYAGASAPAGYLLCDGGPVSRTTYADLFAVCGTTYGAGDGSTTFNLPDCRSRAVFGAGPGPGLTNRARGATGGEEKHLLTIAEMPSHTHNWTPWSGAAWFDWSSTGFEAAQTAGGRAYNFAAATNSNTGGDGTHNTVPPFLALNYIIKT